MKLTAENIQFIDNYLKNSEVIYYDIRMEMLDHVATAVEQKMAAENLDFYDAFKSYMVVNKKGLMLQNEKTLKFNFRFIIPFLKYCAKPQNLLVFLFSYLLFYFGIQKYSVLLVSRIIVGTVFFGMIAWVLFNFIYFSFSKSKRFYAVEKNGVILFAAYHPVQFYQNGILLGSENVSIFHGIVLTFFLSWFLVFLLFNRTEIQKIKSLKYQH